MSFSQAVQTSRRLCWPIVKYSKASTRGGQPDVVAHKLTAPIDWQEFNQAGLELVVEFREKTETRRTLVVQLTMVWRDPHDDANVTYETLDLNSFGPLASRMKEAPLKVAFQDAASHQSSIVGFRYVVKDSWRRIQLKFASDDEARSFVDEIKDVCPCKETRAAAASAPPLASSQFTQPSSTQRLPRSPPRRRRSLQKRKRSRADPSLHLQPPPPSQRRLAQDHDVDYHHQSDSNSSRNTERFESPFRTPNRSSQQVHSPFRPSFRPSDLSRTPIIAAPAYGDEDDEEDVFLAPRAPTQRRLYSPRASSSFSTSDRLTPAAPAEAPAASDTSPLVPSVAAARDGQMNGEALAEALTKAAPSALYNSDLSQDQLERLVEEIVREEGFANLCGRVGRMWKARVLGAAARD